MFITDVVEPAALTGYVREEVSGSLPFAGIFPVDAVDDIEYELENIDLRGSAEVARYRTWDTVPDIGKRPGIRIIGGEIPPLGWSYRLNEKDLGRIGRMRQGVADRTDRRVVDVIFDDAKRASEAVQNRLTIAHAELLQTGAVLLRELGDVADPEAGMQATFAVPPEQLNVAPAVLWTDRNASTPLSDLLAWEEIYAGNNNGQPPEAWLVSKETMLDLVLNAQLRGHFSFSTGTAIGIPAQIDDTAVASVLTRMGVQAPLRVVDVRRPGLGGGARRRLIEPGSVIGVKAGMGKTLYGVPPVIAVMNGNARLERRDAPGIVAYATESIRPPQVITTAEAVSMPVLTDPYGLFVARVR